MAEMSRKKKVGILVVVLLLLLPLFMASSMGLGMLESIAIDHAPADWAASLDLKVADFYGVSLRPTDQKEVCQRFLATFTADPRRGYAKYCIAVATERETESNNDHIRQAYEEFLDEYADDPNSQEYVRKAEEAIVRLRTL